jgi:hypothetical protein
MPHRVPKCARHFAQLAKELNQAILDNDDERQSSLYHELESIVALNRDSPEVESKAALSRERRRIVAAIYRSLEKIRKHDPNLARVLAGALKTRRFFTYSPESTRPTIDTSDREPESRKPPKKIHE